MAQTTEPLKLSIEYCTSWGYDKRAASLAAEIKRALSGRVQDVDLIKGSGGVFEVRNGSDLVFSKRKTGRFPEVGEIVRTLQGAWSS